MRELSLEEIHKVQLDILKDVAAFCEKNNIVYFLNAGTLLGSIRHKGFIPWDDDVDIEMPRESYDRFLKIYKSDHNYRVYSVYSDHDYFFPIAKVASYGTVLERYRRAELELGINIDVFPMDSFQSQNQIERIHRKILPFRRMVGLSGYMNFRDMRRSFGIKALLFWPLSAPRLINFYAKMIDKLARTYSGRNGDLLATIAAPGYRPSLFYMYLDILPARKEGAFEGNVFYIPNNTDKFLSDLYGDYMELPPKEKQKAPHHHKAYIKTEVHCIVKENEEFGVIDVMVSNEDFQSVGFDYGDSCNISFFNGKTYKNVPFYNGYHGKTNELAVVAYYGEGNIKVARCNGSPTWYEVGCTDGDYVLIELNEKGTYLKEQKVMNLHHSDEVSDYNNPEEFSNFRVLNGGKIKPGIIYRGASPVNNLYGRATEVDKLLGKYRIKQIYNLADTDERMAEYINDANFPLRNFMHLYQTGKVVPVGINCAYRTEQFAKKLVAMLRNMESREGPFYLTCTEGKSRTGFVCMLLECIAGYSLQELEDDYMTSYRCYFGITKDTAQDSYNAIFNLRFNDDITWLCGVNDVKELYGYILEQSAKAYLLKGGMTETEYVQLQTLLVRD